MENKYSKKELVIELFKFDIIKAENREETFDEEIRNDLETLSYTEILAKILSRDIKWIRPTEKGEEALPESLPTRNGDIYCVGLLRERDRTMYKDLKESKITDFPYSWVVIDFREGVGQIAIQKSSAMGSSEMVAGVITTTLNSLLFEWGLEMKLYIKTLPVQFWNYYEERVAMGNRPRKLTIEFTRDRHNTEIDTCNLGEKVAFAKQMIEYNTRMAHYQNVIKCNMDITLGYRDDKAQVSADLAHIIHLTAENGYNLYMKLDDGTEVWSHRDLRARQNIREGILQEFVDRPEGSDTLFGKYKKLKEWLDKARETTKDYDAKTPAGGRTKKRSKKSA